MVYDTMLKTLKTEKFQIPLRKGIILCMTESETAVEVWRDSKMPYLVERLNSTTAQASMNACVNALATQGSVWIYATDYMAAKQVAKYTGKQILFVYNNGIQYHAYVLSITTHKTPVACPNPTQTAFSGVTEKTWIEIADLQSGTGGVQIGTLRLVRNGNLLSASIQNNNGPGRSIFYAQ